MLKKILITLFLVPVIGAAIYGYFHFKQIKTPLSSVIKAIPANAAVVLKCNTPKSSLQNFSLSNPMWKSLVTYPFFGDLHTDMRFLDALFTTNVEAYKNIQDKALFISAHPDASNHFGLLYLLNLPNTISKKQVNDFIQNAATKTSVYSLRIYDGVALNELKINEEKTLYYFFNQGIFACTFSRFLMEDAIVQLNSGTPISADPAFDKIWNAAGKKVEASLFINYNYFPQLFATMLESKESGFLKSFSTFANWTCLDIKTKANSYQLNGFTLSKDSSNNYLSIFKNQEPQEFDLAEELPSSVAYFQHTALSDINRYFKNYDAYLNNLKDHFTRQEQVSKFNKSFGVNAQNFFKQWMGNQFAYVITEPENENYTSSCYAVFKTNGNKEVNQLLLEFTNKINNKQPQADSIAENFRGFTIQQIKAESLIPMVFGESFEKINASYFVLMDETVVFGNSAAALKKWINSILAGHTLSTDADYKSFAENTSSQSNLYVYTALARSPFLFQKAFKKEVLNWSDAKTKTLQEFHAVALQMSANAGMLYSSIYASYKPCYKKADESLLEIQLDTTILTKPSILLDPSDSSRFIFVQDAANKIYLIDNKGKILWKREMKEKIMSEVQSVNDKKEMQFAFSTKTKIYVLDKDGDNVAKFPVVLKYLATNGVKAIDYENNGEYRLLIAEENKRIYNYTLRGDAVNGWEAVSNSDKVIAPISNFRAKGLDYLVILDQSGSVNLLDRKGKSVVKFKQKLKNVYRNRYFLAVENTLNASSLVACDSSGLVMRLYFSGNLDKSQVLKTNQAFYFNYVGEAQNYIILTADKLSVYDASRTKISESKLKLKYLFEPAVLTEKNKSFSIAVVNPEQNLMLISASGSILSTHEINATTPLSTAHFYGDDSWYSIIGAGNKIKVYAGY